MNDSNNQTEGRVSEVPEQVTAPPEKPQKRIETKEILIAVLVLLLLVLIPVAYALGRSQPAVDTSSNISSGMSSTSSASDAGPDEEVDKAEIDEIDEIDAYANWHTYENATYGYSFKYPSDWQVEREVFNGSADWVSINPSEQAATSDVGDVLAIFTYADGAGCPKTTTKEFSVGGYNLEGIACAGTEVYKVTMKHSKVAASGNSGVILARTAPDMVGIQIDMSRGENETIQRILDSVTGLTPYGN